MRSDSDAVIVGIGETAYRRRGGWAGVTELGLAARAIAAAAADARVPLTDIDGLCSFANEMPGEDAYGAALLQVALGLPALRHASFVWCAGGGGACGALAHAAAAVRSGHAQLVAVVRALCQAHSARYGQYNPHRPFYNWTAPAGAFSPAPLFALWAQRYCHEFGVRPETFAEIALTFRGHAQRNPRALLAGRPLTAEQYFAAPMVADPLRLFDCCLETDGAAAVLVTTRARARDAARPSVEILAVGQGSGPGWGAGPLGSHNMSAGSYASGNMASFARELFGRAGLGPRDVDVAQIYDAFTPMVLAALEDYGFCGRGEAGEWVRGGALRIEGGELPSNTAGGHLSEAYVHGLNLLVEGVRQLRGESHVQVAGAETCLVASSPALSPSSAALLGRS